MKKICVLTATRAEYGLLSLLMQEIRASTDLQLQIIATGTHLSPEFGLTYQVIEQDGFEINEKIEMLLSSDTPVGIAKSMGLATIGFAEALQRLEPDLLVLLGDRYEIIAAAQAALIAKIPIAHLAGGDTTEGAFDESIRHAVTKMSHLHFVTNEAARRRVIQMGENPEYVYNVGSPGIDLIKKISLLSRAELESSLGFQFRAKNILITFHPTTLDKQSPAEQFQELLQAVAQLTDTGIIFTLPNSDTDGRILIKMIDEFVYKHPNAAAYTSLGQLRYLSTIAQVDAVVGNSSSGLYEVPSFKKPTVNIGDRQKGRLQATSIINCHPTAAEIFEALQAAFSLECSDTVNPYGDGNSVERIIKALSQLDDYKQLLQKHFFEVKC